MANVNPYVGGQFHGIFLDAGGFGYNIRNEEFDAHADGIHDDRRAFLRADAKNGTLIIGPGLYRIAAPVTIASPAYIARGAFIIPDPGATVTFTYRPQSANDDWQDTSQGGSFVIPPPPPLPAGDLTVSGNLHVTGNLSNEGEIDLGDGFLTSDLDTGDLRLDGNLLAGDVDVTSVNADTVAATTVSAATVSATTGNITTVNATTANATTINATTGNITSVNATTVSATGTISANAAALTTPLPVGSGGTGLGSVGSTTGYVLAVNAALDGFELIDPGGGVPDPLTVETVNATTGNITTVNATTVGATTGNITNVFASAITATGTVSANAVALTTPLPVGSGGTGLSSVGSTTGYTLAVNSGLNGFELVPFPSGGKVLQVVHAAATNSVNSNSATFIDSNLAATITPTTTTSKVLVLFSRAIRGGLGTGTGSLDLRTQGDVRLMRDSTNIMEVSNVLFWFLTASAIDGNTNPVSFTVSDGDHGVIASGNFLDSPATTSAVTYSLQFRKQAGNGTVNAPANLGQITLLEIAA